MEKPFAQRHSSGKMSGPDSHWNPSNCGTSTGPSPPAVTWLTDLLAKKDL